MLRTHTSYLALIAALFATGAMAGGDGGWNNGNNNGGGGGWNNNNGGKGGGDNNGPWNNNGWQPPPPPPSPLAVQLHPNNNWKKCLSVAGPVFQPGTPVIIYDCNGSPGQNWLINPGATKIQVGGQPFCLDAGEWPNDGTKMKIWNCYDKLPAQNWWYTDDKRIALRDRGFCLDLTNGDTCNNNQMELWSCGWNNANQIWTT